MTPLHMNKKLQPYLKFLLCKSPECLTSLSLSSSLLIHFFKNFIRKKLINYKIDAVKVKKKTHSTLRSTSGRPTLVCLDVHNDIPIPKIIVPVALIDLIIVQICNLKTMIFYRYDPIDTCDPAHLVK